MPHAETGRRAELDYVYARLPVALLHDPGLCQLTAAGRWLFVACYLFATERRVRALPAHLSTPGVIASVARLDQRSATKLLQKCIDAGLFVRNPDGSLSIVNIEVYAHGNAKFRDDPPPVISADFPGNCRKNKREEAEQSRADAENMAGAPDDFLLFMDHYPAHRRGDRSKALTAWTATEAERPAIDSLLTTLEKWTASPQWTDDGGRYVPGAARWLQEKGWESEPPAQPPYPAKDPRTIPGTSLNPADW